MAEIIRAVTEAVDKIGLLAVLIICVVGAAAYVVRWNRTLVNQLIRNTDQMVEVNKAISILSNETITRNTVANNANTESNLKLTKATIENNDKLSTSLENLEFGMSKLEQVVTKMTNAFGSDPTKICAMAVVLKKEGLTDEEIARVIRNFLKSNGGEKPVSTEALDRPTHKE